MLARSGKVSMATKKRSGEEINDRQILCGMGIKLRRLTAGICLITQLAFPMAAAAQGVVNAATQQPVPAQIAIANANTVPYTLGALESAQSVAERFGISVAELRKLNQFRTFARGFDNVRQGDELDVPAQVSENNLTPPPGNSSDNLEQQIASTSQQIGSLLAEDMNSEQVANMARGWASSQASGAMTAKTDVNGLATFDLKSSKQEDNTVEVTLENGVKQTLIVSFVGDSSTAQVDLQKSKNEVVADGNDSATMTATVRDAKGNLLNDVMVTFNVNSAEAKLSQTEVNSHDGIATATLTSLKNGDYRVTASVSSGSQANQQVNFIGDQSTAALTLSVPSGDITVTNTAPQHMTATLQDKNGNPLKDKEITFSVPNDVASKFSISNGGKGMTDSNGVAIASLTGTLAGTHMIMARLANSNVSDAQPMTFVADKDRAVVVLQTSKAEIIGNGVDETTLTATVKDPSNHPVAGITVNFTMPQDVAANFTLENNGIAITQANGEAHVTLKGKKAGTHTVTATLGNNNTSDSQPVTFVADKTSAQVVLQMSKDEITGNGVDNATLTATVKDQFDNEVNNLPVTFSSASSGLTLTPGVSNTNESGIAQATLAGVAFGEKTVTASLANNGASDNKTVHFIGDTAAAKIIE